MGEFMANAMPLTSKASLARDEARESFCLRGVPADVSAAIVTLTDRGKVFSSNYTRILTLG